MHFSTDMSSSNNKCVLTPQEAAPYDKIDLIRSSNSFEYIQLRRHTMRVCSI